MGHHLKKGDALTLFALFVCVLSLPNSLHAQELDETNFRPNRLLRERGISPPEERFRWYYEQRAYPYDTLRQGYLLEAYNSLRNSPQLESNFLNWESLGPRPQLSSTFGDMTGRVPAIAPHPTNPNIVYLGGANGGVWRTTNGGVNWIPISDNIPSLATGSLALDPSNPNILYYGTGEKYNANYAYGGVGVLKTANAMHASPTWEVSGLSNEKRIAKIVVDPNNSSIVFAAAWGGLYRSTNAGGSWTQVLGFGHVWDVRIHPTNSNIVYAAVGQNSTNAGMWRSTSGGITGSWVQQTNGLPAPSAIRRIAFDISASNSSILYAIMAASSPNGGYLGLYRTFDGGQNWELAPDSSLASLFGSPGSAGQGWYDICLAINPSDHNTIFVGGVRLYRTTNAGLTWTSYGGSGGLGVDFHEIVFGPGAVYIGLDQGIWKSTNNGESWINLNTDLTLAQFYAIGVGGPSAPRKLIAGGQDIGTLRTSGSVQWPTGFLGDGAMGLIDPVDTNLVYASGAAGLRYRSTNGGSSYSSINTGISLFESRTWVTPFFMDRQNPEILYTATDRLYRTTNRGDSWVPTTTAGINGTASVRWIEIDPTNSSIIYVASHTRVSRSMDGGATWVHVSSGLPSRIVTRVVVDPLNPATLYATVSGTGTAHVFKSTNRGDAWASISSDLPDIPVSALLVNPSNNNTIYLGTDLGVFITTNGGASWTKDANFLNTAVIDLKLSSDGFLIAATHGRGAFKAPISVEPFVTVIAPNGGENWSVNSTQNIRWSSSGVSAVRLEYSTNNGSSWTNIISSTSASAGSFAWTVPSTPTTQALVRVSNASDLSMNDRSDAVFTISTPTSSVQLTAPNGGESWQVGTQQNITWTQSNVLNVDLSYSTNNGASWIAIASNVSPTPPFVWTIPNTPTTQARVRIINSSNINVRDSSDNAFSIVSPPQPSITLIAPNGGEAWMVGSSQSIRWNAENIATVRIEYSTNDGASWQTIDPSVSAASSPYAWSVPNTPTTAARVRVSDASNTAVNDVSDAAFSIVAPPPPSVIVLSPNGGETWLSGSQRTISWSFTSVANVRLEYSTNNGASWNLITSSWPASTAFIWTVPNTPSTQARVRVSDAANLSINDQSDGPFTIALPPSVTVISPNGGEVWDVGSVQTISWSSVNVSSVKIEYSTNNGNAWILIADNVPAPVAEVTDPDDVGELVRQVVPSGSLQWTVPNTPSTQALVRVTSTSEGTVSDVSNGVFTINLPKTLRVTSPNGGEEWRVGETRSITWVHTNISSIRVEYSTNNGAFWSTITNNTSAGPGSLSWTVPNTPTMQARVRITERPDGISDQSDGVFEIFVPSVTVDSPNGGQVWPAGTQQLIEWTSRGVSTVRIEYSSNNGTSWNFIDTIAAAIGSYTWTLPNISTTAARVRIASTSDASVNDISDGPFSIERPFVDLLSPNGGEVLVAGAQDTITWTQSNVTGVRLDYSTNNGGSWITIISSTPAGSGSFAWTIPATATTQGRVRIQSTADPGVQDMSAGVFTILVPRILVLSPNGGEVFDIDSERNLSWSATNVANVRLEYSTNNGTSWNLIEWSVAAGSSPYAWTVPNPPTTQARVRVSDVANAATNDMSDAVFTIRVPPPVTVTSPNGGEVWTVGTQDTITWTSINVANVRLEYSTNNGTTWAEIEESVPATPASYAWTIPNTPTVQGRVRVSDVTNAATNDVSDGAFTIQVPPSVDLTRPNGGDSWIVGTQESITWTPSAVTDVQLQFSTNAGTSWSTIVASTPAAAGSFVWTIPNTPTTQALVRVRSVADTSVADTSNGVFNILTRPTVIVPNGGEFFVVGARDTIRWSPTNIPNLRIEYSSNNGSTWGLVALSAPSAPGFFAWTVPNVPSTQALVRLRDPSGGATLDVSDNPFTILYPAITVFVPNGTEQWRGGSTNDIIWQHSGVRKVAIEYTLDDGLSWTLIDSVNVPLVADSARFTWHVPNTPSTAARIRVHDIGNPTLSISDASDNVFTIFRPSITVLTPNGGEVWPVGGARVIRWQKNFVSRVKIELSRDNGLTWEILAADVSADSAFAWIVDGDTSSLCLVRVRETIDPTIQDQSDSTFTIFISPAFVEILRPHAGDSLIVQTPFEIRWTKSSVDSVTIEYSPDGGSTWEPVAVRVPGSMYVWEAPADPTHQGRIRIFDSNNPAVIDTSDFFIVHTLNPGFLTGWELQTSNTTASLTTVKAVNEAVAWVGGLNGVVMRTTNEGDTWVVLAPLSGEVRSIEAIDQNIALVALADAGGTRIMRTSNSGLSWQQVFVQNNGRLNALKMFDANNGVAVGNAVEGRWTFIKTVNGGVTWTPATGPFQSGTEQGWPNSMFWTSSTRGWFGTNNSRVYFTNNGGNSWQSGSTPFTNILALYFITTQAGIGGSSNGVVALTTNGGSSWNSVLTGTTPVKGIAGIGSTHISMVRGSQILTSTDGGNSWLPHFTAMADWNHVSMVSSGSLFRGWAVGENGMIARYTNQATFTEEPPEAIPTKFVLRKNYPNPFNPLTIISYDLPSSGYVRLKVYNIIGQEIAALVDEVQNGGRYSVPFSGEALSSGVYFARILFSNGQDDTIIRTTKMLLTK